MAGCTASPPPPPHGPKGPPGKNLLASQVHNKRGGQIKRVGFKDFEKLLNGEVKISGTGGNKI